MRHFQYKLTTKAGNLVLNLEKKAKKKKDDKIIHTFFKQAISPAIRRER